MIKEPIFLTVEDILYIHNEELKTAGGADGIRNFEGLLSTVGIVEASFGGVYLMDIFEMASTYITSICFNHPFLDGNKRTALASALTFLYINGIELQENYEEEFADKIIDLVEHKMNKNDLADLLKERKK